MNQPRDWRGRWTRTGGSKGAAGGAALDPEDLGKGARGKLAGDVRMAFQGDIDAVDNPGLKAALKYARTLKATGPAKTRLKELTRSMREALAERKKNPFFD